MIVPPSRAPLRGPSMALLLVISAAACSPGDAKAEPSDEDPVAADRAPSLALKVTPRTRLATGEVAVFDVVVPPSRPPLRKLEATFGAHRVAVAPWDAAGRRFLVLTSIDIEEQERALELSLTGADTEGAPLLTLRRFAIEEATYDERHLRVAKKMVKPPKKARERAAREKEDLKVVLDAPDAERHWRGGFARPVSAKATSPFGTLRTYNRRKTQSRHLGWDLDGKTGDPIVATGRGRVAMVQERYYAGGTVIIDHGQGLFSMYFHMSAFDVEVGQMVGKGQKIGEVGKTGRVTGPHLHFGFKLDGIYLSPETLLEARLDDDPLAQPPPVDRVASPLQPEQAAAP
jgi:murein DD-endopeptidase MepM/ murein hydrolase activator NlpD